MTTIPKTQPHVHTWIVFRAGGWLSLRQCSACKAIETASS